MPKFGQMVKIREPRSKKPAYGEVGARVVEIVDEIPGISAGAFKYKGMNQCSVNTALARLVSQKKIKFRVQDGLKRYYPKNYLFAEDIKEKSVPVLENPAMSVPSSLADNIERLAKDFVWNYPGSIDRLPLQNFIEWVRENGS